jgi:hypothetical protein
MTTRWEATSDAPRPELAVGTLRRYHMLIVLLVTPKRKACYTLAQTRF